MTGTDVLTHLLVERLVVIGAVFVALLVLVLVTAWLVRTGRR